jgi:predicted permease
MMGIPLLRGRSFSLHDTENTPRVAIVNEAAAAQFWPGEEAIGKRLRFFGDSLAAEVVGVARNANYRAIGESPQPYLYLSLIQYYSPMAAVYVRASGDPEATATAVRKAIQPMDRNLLLESGSLDRAIRESLWAQRLSAGLLAVFGVLALLLAAVGIYGVISYSVNQRVRELGVRMAMGATPADLQRMILTQGMRVAGSGVVVGLIMALAGSRWVASLLFATRPHDAVVFLIVPPVLLLVAAIACWLPARRATRIDPATALRDE